MYTWMVHRRICVGRYCILEYSKHGNPLISGTRTSLYTIQVLFARRALRVISMNVRVCTGTHGRIRVSTFDISFADYLQVSPRHRDVVTILNNFLSRT